MYQEKSGFIRILRKRNLKEDSFATVKSLCVSGGSPLEKVDVNDVPIVVPSNVTKGLVTDYS